MSPPEATAAPAAWRRWAALGLMVVLLTALAAWPLRDAILLGEVPGAGPDVVSTLFGNWWASQVGPIAALGGHTDLVNHPSGATGAILSPSSVLVYGLLSLFVGPGGASTGVVLVQIVGLAAGCAWLSRRLGASAGAAFVAALFVVAGRYLFHGAGEGSAVAIAALPLPLGLGLLVAVWRDGGARVAAGLAACMPWLATENPYLAPVLPAIVGVFLIWAALQKRSRTALILLLALVAGSGGVALIGALFGRAASPDYPVEVADQILYLGQLALPVTDLPWARVAPLDIIRPADLAWVVEADDARSGAGGGRYLGLGGAILALIGLALGGSTGRAFGALAIGALVLSLGSMVGQIGAPFIYLNLLMDTVARPLTQPVRFLAVAQVGLAIAAAAGADGLAKRAGRWRLPTLGFCALMIVADGVLWGGQSLRTPTLSVPNVDCLDDLPAGGVLTWPTDALEDWPEVSQLAQLSHGRASPHRGIASWRLDEPVASRRLRALGWDRSGTTLPDIPKLVALGYRFALLEPGASDVEADWMRTEFGPATTTCAGFEAFDLVRIVESGTEILRPPRGRAHKTKPGGERP